MYKSRMMNKYKKKYYAKTANLLTGETAATEEEQAKAVAGIKHEVFSHWHPNITVNLVNDYTPWVPGQVPPPLDEFVEFTPSMQNYKPILYMNDYWNLNKVRKNFILNMVSNFVYFTVSVYSDDFVDIVDIVYFVELSTLSIQLVLSNRSILSILSISLISSNCRLCRYN